MATVTCSWSTDGPADAELLQHALQTLVEGADVPALSGAAEPLVLTPPTSDAQAPPPCELYVSVPAGHALERVSVRSSARTVELYVGSQSSAAMQYSGSSGRGAPQEDGTWECDVSHDTDTVPNAAVLRLKLVSLATPQRVVLHSVRLHIHGVRKAASLLAAPSPADTAASLPPQLLTMLSSLVVGGSDASGRKGGGAAAARKAAAAAPDSAELQRLVDARMSAMEARLEARMDKLCADVEQRLRRLEQAVMGP